MEAVWLDIQARLTTLQWLVGLSMAWNTMLWAAAVGILLKYR